MQLDERAIEFLKLAKEQGASAQEAASFLRTKGYDIPQAPAQEEPKEKEGLIKGTARSAENAFLMGQGSRLAGLDEATGGAISKALNPMKVVGDILSGNAFKREDSSKTFQQRYEEGKSNYEQAMQQFAEEHPAASAIGDVAGTVGSLVAGGAAIRGAATAAVGAARMAKAAQTLGKAGTLGARAVAEGINFGTYEGVRRGYGEGRSDFGEAVKGFESGATLGAGLGVIGGAMSAAEPILVKKAIEMGIANETGASLAGRGVSALVEGGTLATIPAVLEEDRLPTAKEFLTGVAFAAGARGAADLGSKALEKGRKWITEPSEGRLKTIQEKASVNEQLNSLEMEKQKLSFEKSNLAKEEIQDATTKSRINSIDERIAEINKQQDFLRTPVIKEGGVEVSDKEVEKYLEENKNNKYVTPETARLDLKRIKSLERAKEKSATETRTFREKAQDWFDYIRTQFNAMRPLQKGEELFTKLTGVEIPFDKRPSVRLARLTNRGEVESMLRPVADKVQELQKKNPAIITQYDNYAQAKKDLQMGINDGRYSAAETEESLAQQIGSLKQDQIALQTREEQLKIARANQTDLDNISNKIKENAEEIKTLEKQFDDLQTIRAYSGNDTVVELEKEVRKVNQESLKNLRDAGIIDEESYQKFLKNDAYVPTKSIKEFVDGEPIVKNIDESFLQKYKGAVSLEEGALESSLIQARNIKSLTEINKAKQEYLEIAKKTGEASLEDAGLSYKGGKVNYNRKNQIVVKVDGKPQIWNVPENVAQFFNPIPRQPETRLEKFLRNFMNIYKGGTTATSLGFSYSNLTRDVQSAAMMSKYGGFIDPAMIRESAGEYISKAPIAMAEFKEQGSKTLLRQEQIRALNKDAVEDVVNMYKSIEEGAGNTAGQKGLAAMLTAGLPKWAKKLIGVSKGSAKNALEALTYGGQLGEETTRLAVFKATLKAKAPSEAAYRAWIKNPDLIPSAIRAEAGHEAREVTLNFNRQMAPWVEKFNRYYLPYFKPSILGAMRGFEALTNPEIAPRAWRAIMNFGILQGMISAKAVDKEQMDAFNAVNNEMKAKNFVLPGKDGRIYTLPLSQELGPLVKLFGLATEALVRGAKGNKQREGMWKESGAAALEELQNLIPVAGYISAPSNLIVSGAKPVLEQVINKELFSNVPIEPENMKALPASMRYSANTSRTLISVAKWAKNILGLEISPMRLQHLVKSVASSSGKEMLAASDYALSTLLSADLRPKGTMEDNPLIRRFVANIYAPYNQTAIDARNIIEDNKKGYTALSKGLARKGEANYEKYLKQARIYGYIKGPADALTQLYSKRKQVLKALEREGVTNRAKYERGEITKEQLIYANDKAIAKYSDILDVMRTQQRVLELQVLDNYKKAKKTLAK